MLELHSVLWVIPGVVFIYFYNKKKPYEAISLFGWPYLFFLVIIAALTWLPAEFIITSGIFKKLITGLIEVGVDKKVITLLIAVIFSGVLLLLSQLEIIANLIFSPVCDNFFNKCIEWEDKEVFLTLKNEKVYHGLLWLGPDNANSKYESQTVSIIPFKSGYRDQEKKNVMWNNYYPVYENESDVIDMEVIIPRSEIITFGRFNEKVFEYFYSGNDPRNPTDNLPVGQKSRSYGRL